MCFTVSAPCIYFGVYLHLVVRPAHKPVDGSHKRIGAEVIKGAVRNLGIWVILDQLDMGSVIL
jgi:hypothetical protein